MESQVVIVEGMKFHYSVVKHEGEGISATCIELPAVAVFGASLSEIKVELEKAIQGYIEAFGLPDLRPATPA
jgi:predicted RNase H-like HicB family nuclease